MVYLPVAVFIGIALFIFRIWLVEFRLADILQFRRRYFSRFFSYYACLSLAFGLQFLPFNIIVIIAFPILVVTSVWDINFYRRFKNQEHWSDDKTWGLVERLTLHPPVVLVALFIIFSDARNYILAPNLILIAVTAVVLFMPFFLLDERWTKRYKWPEALIVIGLVIASGVSLLLAEAILWGVPIW